MSNTGLYIKLMVNSSAEDVLGWKCCNLMDMNMELHVYNEDSGPFLMKSEIELVGEAGIEKVDYLYPNGVHEIGPHQALSFYFSLDENRARMFDRVVIYDRSQKRFEAPITGEREPAHVLDPGFDNLKDRHAGTS